MIFVGDIAIPYGSTIKVRDFPATPQKKVVANLEGCIVPEEPQNKMSVYNSRQAVSFLLRNNVAAVSLANNHILDEEEWLDYTKDILSENGILSFGAGHGDEGVKNEIKFVSNGEECHILSYAWEVTGISNKRRRANVSLLKRDKVIDDIKRIKKTDGAAKIICYMHWGYELECYPLPRDRELAREFIDVGAYAVIGCHSHCIQGIEFYQGKPIVYGLGNFCFQEGKYMNGKLIYPQMAHEAIAFEIDGNNRYLCHWLQYDPERNIVTYTGTTEADDDRVKQKAPYAGMSQKEYILWFKKNRRKKKMLPLFRTSRENCLYGIEKSWCKLRGTMVRMLVKLGIKGGPN